VGTSELLAEEGALELPRLRGREPGLCEYLHDLVSDLPLLGRKRRWIPVPAQTGADVRVKPGVLTRELVGKSMQLANLVEQRLKRRILDGHELRLPCGLDAPLAASPD
jgi:hypothetical protein